MTERKAFLLRLEAETMAALRAWAGDDLRSLNGQIEFLLRRALRDAGRLPTAARPYGSASSREIREASEPDAEIGVAGRPDVR